MGSDASVEIIVVNDCSTDNTSAIANGFSVLLLDTARRLGPASARNLGAQVAQGELLFFLDADVCVRTNTLLKVIQAFEMDPSLAALIGSYDDDPAAPDFLSQYRNLMHAYVHQSGAENASTFWSGCGAIRRSIFLEQSGFDESYDRPAIEDIELGYRLVRAGQKIILDRDLLVTHLKKWTFWGLLKTDICDRGIPWTELILREKHMPNDLNIQLSQRVSVALVFTFVAFAGVLTVLSGVYFLIPMLAIVFIMLARWWSEFADRRRPKAVLAVILIVNATIVATAYSRHMYGIIPPLLAGPLLLLLGHRYDKNAEVRKSHRRARVIFIACSVLMSALYLPSQHLLSLTCFALLAILGFLNSQFYLFLAGKRGFAFMLAAIPFHLLYHFYNGVSFISGYCRHLWSTWFAVDGRTHRSR